MKKQSVSYRWAIKEPNKPLEEKIFDIEFEDEDDRTEKELKLVQGLVDGYVEPVHIGGQVMILCNEEGIFKNLKSNCGFLGTLIFYHEHYDEETEEVSWASLSHEEIRKIKAWITIHENDKRPYYDFKVLVGEEAAKHLKKINETKTERQKEWESL